MRKLLILIIGFIGSIAASGQQQHLNYGTNPNDHTGDPLRTLMQKIEHNTSELYDQAHSEKNGYRSISTGGSLGTGNLTIGSVMKTIVPYNGKHNAFPGITTLPNGDLYVVYRCGKTHASFDGGISACISKDMGRTWSTPSIILPAPTGQAFIGAEITTLRSGSLLLTYCMRDTIYSVNGVEQHDSVYVVIGSYVISTDAVSWGRKILVNTGFTDYAANGPDKPLELANGTILLPIYGQNTGDATPRSSVMTSSDHGLTWGSRKDIAYLSSHDFSETSLVLLPNGRVIALVRCAASNTNYNGVFRSYSDDNGLTWSAPVQVLNIYPCKPAVVRLKSGALFMLTRNATTKQPMYYRTSWDDGLTWTSTAYNTLGYEGMDYASMTLLSGGEVASVFAVDNYGTSGEYNLYYRNFIDGNGLFSSEVVSDKLTIKQIPAYNDNAAAVSAGLAVGSFYRTGDILKIVH